MSVVVNTPLSFARPSVQRQLQIDDAEQRTIDAKKLAEVAKNAKNAPGAKYLSAAERDRLSAASVDADAEVKRAVEAEKETKKSAKAAPVPKGAHSETLRKIRVSAQKVPLANKANVHTILTGDPRFLAGGEYHMEFNSFIGMYTFGRRQPSDAIDTEVALILDRYYHVSVHTKLVCEVAYYASHATTYHPIVDYLSTLVWDGTSRLRDFALRGLGAVIDDDQTEAYALAVVTVLLVSGIARAREPGCKADNMVALVSRKQGKFKSSACKALFGRKLYSDTGIDLSNKDCYIQIQGKWGYEIAEFDAFKNRAASRIKNYMSSAEDNYRPPFLRHAVCQPRSLIFMASTNEEQCLADPTGSRRFLPLRIHKCDPEWITEHRDQVWAEADALYAAGTRWWLDEGEELARERASERHQVIDPWTEPVASWVAGRVAGVTEYEVATLALSILPAQVTTRIGERIATVLGTLGWELGGRARRNGAYRPLWIPGPPGPDADDAAAERVRVVDRLRAEAAARGGGPAPDIDWSEN